MNHSACGQKRNEMKRATAFCLLVILVSTAFAQNKGSVAGKVTAHQRAIQLTVVLNQGGKEIGRTKSKADGTFLFVNVPDGSYELAVTFDDLKPVGGGEPKAIEIRNSERATVDFAVDLVVSTAQPGLPIREFVTISADEEQPIEQVTKSVNLIGAQEMRDRADITLADSLRTIPGFRVQQLGGFGRVASVKSRGLRNHDTALLIDGVRFRDATAITGDASPFLGDITLTSVSRVEVLRGPGSSLYGTNAIGGTIDFQTPIPQKGWHGQVSGAGGGLGFGRFRGNASYGTTDGKFGFNAGVSRTVYTKGIDGNDEANNTGFQSRIEFRPTERSNISGRFFFSNAYVRLNTSPNTIGPLPADPATIIDAIPLSLEELERYANGTPIDQLNPGNANFIPDTNDPDSFQRSKAFSGQFAHTQSVNDEFSFQVWYQGLRTSRDNTNGPLGVGFQPFSGADETSRFIGKIHTFNGHFDWTPNRSNRLTAGYEFESENFFNEGITINPADNFSVDASQSSNAFFAQDLISLHDGRLQIAGGFRAQFFSLGDPIFVPVDNPTYEDLVLENPPTAFTADVSVSYYFRSTDTKLRGHIGNGYRVPSLYERFGSSFFFGSFSASGDPFLTPERSIGGDVAIEQKFFNDRLRLTAAYFYTDIKKSIDFAFCVPQCLPSDDPLDRFLGYYNTEGRIARGLEFTGEIKPSESTSIFTSYTYTNSDERNPLNLSVLTSPGIPDHQFTLVATQRFGKRLSVNFDFVATSKYFFPFYSFNNVTFAENYFFYRFKGSRRGDLTVRYEHPLLMEKAKLVIHGTVENIFGYDYFDNAFRTVGRTGRIGVGFSF